MKGAITETDSWPTAEQKPPKLRWYQWRLRSLFILTLLVAIVCSWLTVTIQNQRKQHAAAVAIENAGGFVISEPTWLGKVLRDDSLVSVTGVCFSDAMWFTDAGLVHLQGLSNHKRHTQVTDAWLVHLQGLRYLRTLALGRTMVTDAGLVHLQELSQLQSLNLEYTQVTDAGLVHLQGLSKLEGLNLSGTRVTDAGLVHLEGLSQLDCLELSNTQITDAGLAHIRGLYNLSSLSLSGTRITGIGLEELKGLPLAKLDISNTNITNAGLEHLKGLTMDEFLDLTKVTGLRVYRTVSSLNIKNTQVTDAGLVHLEGLHLLLTLGLEGTKVTAKGVRKLQHALPNCKIIR